MEIVHETESVIASFQSSNSILICEAKESETIDMDSLLGVLQIWFENSVKYGRNFAMILDLHRAQADLVSPCMKVANFFNQLDEKYTEFLKKVAISGCSWYYVELMNSVYTSDIPYKAVETIQDGIEWIKDT